jgi:hypothetical protein
MWFAALLAALDDVASAGAATRHDTRLRERLGIPMHIRKTGAWYLEGGGPRGKKVYETLLEVKAWDVTLALKYLGRGKFATAWADESVPGRVWVRIPWAAQDWSKELTARLLEKVDNPHLPYVRQVGRDGESTIYVMPRYKMPLLREDVSAEVWAQVRALQRCHKKAYENAWQWGRSQNEKAREDIVACAHADPVFASAPKLLEALDALNQAAYDYGDGAAFDTFPARNLGTDAEGRLILIDTVFNQHAVARL